METAKVLAASQAKNLKFIMRQYPTHDFEDFKFTCDSTTTLLFSTNYHDVARRLENVNIERIA